MFVFGKLAEIMAAPLNLLVAALWLAIILWLARRQRAAKRIVVAAAVLMLATALPPWSHWVVEPLEDRFPFPASLPERVDGVIVLGGAISPVISEARGQPTINGAGERMFSMLELARRYPQAQLVFTGGSGNFTRPNLKEAPVARDLLDRAGLDTSRVIFEDQSRNTWENAVFSRELVHPQPGQTWLLVTSAWHMPRSVGVFRAADWPVVAYPVDYTTSGQVDEFSVGVQGNLQALALGMHEWIGLAYYRLRGWCDSLFPAP